MAIFLHEGAVSRGLAMAVTAAPASAEAVTITIRETILGLWSDFIERLPFLAAGIALLLATALVVAIATRIVNRILKRSDLRQSLQSLILRFVTIIIWVVGWLLAAMIVFPGLTPAKALGAMGIASVAVGFAFKDIFENFLAGVLMLWQFPFENGDFITC